MPLYMLNDVLKSYEVAEIMTRGEKRQGLCSGALQHGEIEREGLQWR